MTASLDALVRELADAVKGDADDLPVRLRKGVVFAQSPLTVKVGGSSVAVPVQATGPIPANGTVVWVMESGPRRVLLDVNRGPYLPLAGKAADSELLDGIDSTGFTKTTQSDTLVAAQRSQIGQFVARTDQFRWKNGRIYWTGRLISIAHGRGSHWSTDGWFGFYCPQPNAGGVIPGYGGHGGFSVDGGQGIPIGAHQALYGVPTVGGASGATSLALVNYTSGFVVPPHWVLIGVQSESDGRLMLGNGELLDEWRGVNFANGWSQYGDTSFGVAGYRKDGAGMVKLRGLIQAGTAGVAAFNLPTGYRPGHTAIVSTVGASAFQEIRIEPNGDFRPQGAPGWLSLDGISPFLAEN